MTPPSSLEDDTTVTDAPADDRLAVQLAAVVAAHPSVVRLDGGTYGAVLTYLPDEPVEIAVVLRLDRAIPETVAQLRAAVAAVYDGPVDITVSDVVTAADPPEDPGPAGPVAGGPVPRDPGRPG